MIAETISQGATSLITMNPDEVVQFLKIHQAARNGLI